MQEPVTVFNRFSPIYLFGVAFNTKIEELSQEIAVDDTLNDLDYEFSDLEGNPDILESNVEICSNVQL